MSGGVCGICGLPLPSVGVHSSYRACIDALMAAPAASEAARDQVWTDTIFGGPQPALTPEQGAEILMARLAKAEAVGDFDARFADQLKEFGTIDRLVDAYRESKIKVREAEAARERVEAALQEIEAHHVEQNAHKGRDESRSTTLRIARAALREPAPTQEGRK